MRSPYLYKDEMVVVKCKRCHKPFFDRDEAENHAKDCDAENKHHVDVRVEEDAGIR